MNIMNRVAWRAMWQNKVRTVVTIIGVILSAAMFMAVTTSVYSLWDFMVRGYVYEIGDFYVQFDYASDDHADAILQRDGLECIADCKIIGNVNQWDSVNPSGTYRVAAVDGNFFEIMSVPLTHGRLPENSSEIILPERFNENLAYQGKEEISLGQTVTLEMFSTIQSDEEYPVAAAAAGKNTSKTYTVVGFMKDRTFSLDYDQWGFLGILTRADGNEGTTLWHRLFVKTKNPTEAKALSGEDFGGASWLYTDLLKMYGLTDASNERLMLYLLASVICVIILAASVSLISNAFSISVSERIKQFGLLSGVGATRRQLRKSVLFEAAVIGAMGIPVGILAGFLGVSALLTVYGKSILRLFSFSVSGGVEVYATASWAAILTAVLICTFTIFISARTPARRATRITAIAAIRQTNDYKARQRELKTGKLTKLLFGLPGMLGKKYYKVSRRKYRSTVVSLCISMVLLIVSAYFSDALSMVADANRTEDADFSCNSQTSDPMGDYEWVRSLPGVESSVIVSEASMKSVLPTNALPKGLKEVFSDQHYFEPKDYPEDGWTVENISLQFMEDEAFVDILQAQGVNPEPYLYGDTPVAVQVMQEFGGWYVQNEAGEWIKLSYYGYPLTKSTESISLFESRIPQALKPYMPTSGMLKESVTSDGELILSIVGFDTLMGDNGIISPTETGECVSFLIERTEKMQDGVPLLNYYTYDTATGTRSAIPIASEYAVTPEIRLGAQLENWPFGTQHPVSGGFILLLPLSKAESILQKNVSGVLYLNVSDEAYEDVLLALEEKAENANGRFSYYNHIETEMNQKGILELIYAFATGFIILIALISAANVFNTISTNFALRHRDFGMLRSIGFKSGQLYKMAAFECLNYGIKALLWGLPISCGLCYGIFTITNLRYRTEFSPPWEAICIGIGCIFAVVFITMLYAISKHRKDSPIEAIRMENI